MKNYNQQTACKKLFLKWRKNNIFKEKNGLNIPIISPRLFGISLSKLFFLGVVFYLLKSFKLVARNAVKNLQ